MEELVINHQVVYFAQMNQEGIAMNLFRFGYRQFALATIIKRVDEIKPICEELTTKGTVDHNLILDFAFDQLIDSVRIALCFENFMKGVLLLKGYVIHKLDNKIFKDLSKEQYERPIHYSEIRALKNWEINPKIKTDNESFKLQILGISKLTIGMKDLCTPGYTSVMGIDKDIIDLVVRYSQYRNNLHYYLGETFTIGPSTYSELIKIIDFVNKNVVVFHNDIVTKLKGDSYTIPPISISSDT